MNAESANLSSAPRVAVLGASNVTLGLPVIVDLLRRGWPQSPRLMVAHGHGRSYGMWTRILIRGLPGHRESPLLKSPKDGGTNHVLLTDIGNDLVYGVNVSQIAEWVAATTRTLAEDNAEIVMTGLPLDSIRGLGRRRFLLCRTLFFPTSGLEYSQVFDMASELNQRVQEICHSVGGTFVEPIGDWYGLDPIHIRRSRRVEAWNHVLSHFDDWQSVDQAAISIGDRCRLRFSRAARDSWFGRESHREDVARTLSDGTEISFF